MSATHRYSAVKADDPALPGSSASAEWYSPPWVVDEARDFFAEIGGTLFDPCPPPSEGRVNGLAVSWARKCVWLNPPYRAELIRPWLIKLRTERITEALVLVPGHPGTRWYQAMAARYPSLLFRGRLKFSGARGNGTFDSVLFYVGPRRRYADFARRFARFGVLQTPMPLPRDLRAAQRAAQPPALF